MIPSTNRWKMLKVVYRKKRGNSYPAKILKQLLSVHFSNGIVRMMEDGRAIAKIGRPIKKNERHFLKNNGISIHPGRLVTFKG